MLTLDLIPIRKRTQLAHALSAERRARALQDQGEGAGIRAGYLWQVSFIEMQVFPQAFPFTHFLAAPAAGAAEAIAPVDAGAAGVADVAGVAGVSDFLACFLCFFVFTGQPFGPRFKVRGCAK